MEAVSKSPPMLVTLLNTVKLSAQKKLLFPKRLFCRFFREKGGYAKTNRSDPRKLQNARNNL